MTEEDVKQRMEDKRWWNHPALDVLFLAFTSVSTGIFINEGSVVWAVLSSLGVLIFCAICYTNVAMAGIEGEIRGIERSKAALLDRIDEYRERYSGLPLSSLEQLAELRRAKRKDPPN